MQELLCWIRDRRRSYGEAMEAWQSRCPQNTVWEDALAGGLIQVRRSEGAHQADVELTPRGRRALEAGRQA